MDARTREEIRQGVSRSRVRPDDPQRILFSCDGLGECPELEPRRAAELQLEATDAQGHVAPWLSDDWWIRIRGRCERRPVTVVILPSPGAILADIILHQLGMVRRIAPGWRLIGYSRIEEVLEHEHLESWLPTPYDEIRFCLPTAPRGNAAALEAVQRLVSQAALSPRVPGAHQACLRLTHALPQTAAQRAAVGPRPPAERDVRRIFGADTVEST